jgi:hypothetical protein
MKHLLFIVAIVITAGGAARAQPADATASSKVPLARRLYEEGVDAIGKERWSHAFDRFKASYELAPRVLTLFNLAGAQGKIGHLVEAAESYRRFLRETADGRYADLRTVATDQLEQLDKQIAHVTVDVANIEPDDVIAIDDVEFPHATLREPIPMNPGSHLARVQRGPRVMATRTLTLVAGAVEAVRIELPVKPLDLAIRPPPASPVVTAPVPAPTRPDRGSSRSWLRSPWLWSGVAVVVAGGVAGAYLYMRPDGVVVH